MKFVALFLALFALFGANLALKNPDVCGLPHSVDGNGLIKCAAFIPRFSYNSAANQCTEFVFGGCGGNKNNFETRQQCETTCVE